MAGNSAYVASANPKVTGGFAVAPVGTVLPTDATTALDATFKRGGYITDAGVSRSYDISSESETAWGSVVVWSGQSGYGEEFSLTLMESTNIEALKIAYGADAVTETGSGATAQITVKTSGKELPEFVAVLDMVSGTKDRRIVIPRAKITGRDETNYSSSESVKLGITLVALPDAQGNLSYEYIANPTTP